MQTQDRIIRSFPEVASVYGKAGRAATASDPAPGLLSIMWSTGTRSEFMQRIAVPMPAA
jgi:Cu/Ag efflux pump CusA